MIETNDPIRRKIVLYFNAFVEINFGVEPQFVSFGSVTKGQDYPKKTVELIGLKLPEVKVTTIASSNDFFQAKLLSDEDEATRNKIGLSLVKELPLGSHLSDFTVMTDNPLYTANFRASVVVRGHTKVTPARIVFRCQPGHASQIKQKVIVKNTASEQFLVEKAEYIPGPEIDKETARQAENEGTVLLESSADDLEVTILPQKSSDEVTLELTFKRLLQAKQRLHGCIRITTNDPLEKTLDLQYFAFSTEGKTDK